MKNATKREFRFYPDKMFLELLEKDPHFRHIKETVYDLYLELLDDLLSEDLEQDVSKLNGCGHKIYRLIVGLKYSRDLKVLR